MDFIYLQPSPLHTHWRRGRLLRRRTGGGLTDNQSVILSLRGKQILYHHTYLPLPASREARRGRGKEVRHWDIIMDMFYILLLLLSVCHVMVWCSLCLSVSVSSLSSGWWSDVWSVSVCSDHLALLYFSCFVLMWAAWSGTFLPFRIYPLLVPDLREADNDNNNQLTFMEQGREWRYQSPASLGSRIDHTW